MAVTRRNAIALAAATAAYAATSRFPLPAYAKQEPLKIGILAPKSGTAATIGECGLRGAVWAAEQANKKGGIAGRKVELVIEEETNPADTVERFKRLQQQDVTCVQGIVSTGTSLAVAPVAENLRKLLILWDGTTQNGVKDTMPDAKFVFKSTDNECEAVMASLLTVKYYSGKFRTIAGMNPDYSYGRNNWEAFKQILTRYGIEFKVVGERWCKVGASAEEIAPHVEALKTAKPDLIFSSMLFADLPVFLKQVHDTKALQRAKFVLPAATWQINDLKKEFTPEGTILGWNTLYFADKNASPLQRRFVEDYRKKYKQAPHWEADRAYFAFSAYQQGVEGAYKATGRWPTVEEIMEAIPGKDITSLGGVGRFRDDRVAEQMFYQGLSTNKNNYKFPTLASKNVFSARDLQKPKGDDFWDWIKTAPFPI
jgi:branched-chain amino acid transport system substrate-binding protein